jgi:multidrug efflux pump
MEGLVKAHLPENVIIDYKGQSQDYKYSAQSIGFVFLLGILVVFLVLAAQFESYLNPLVIMLTVPLAIAGGLLGLYLTGSTLNLYSQIGLVMLVGLAAKNGILIVEFANQLRERNKSFDYAILKAAEVRLRPIVMTGITTAAGAIPLILSTGAGAETRMVIGVVVLAGVWRQHCLPCLSCRWPTDCSPGERSRPGRLPEGWRRNASRSEDGPRPSDPWLRGRITD